jgi:fucose permease
LTGWPIPEDRSTSRAVRATCITFVGLGVAIASWAGRIPQVKAQLGLATSQLGLLLLALAAGSLLSLPGAGPLVVRLGSRAALRGAALLAAIGLVIIALGSGGRVAVVAAGLVTLGLAAGVWDVAINVQGALVEQRAGRTLMSRFHAWYSVGAVAGALLGAVLIVTHVSVRADLIGVACVVPIAMWTSAGQYLSDGAPRAAEHHRAARRHNPWRERRTLMIGAMVLAFSLAEGAGGDWISVSMVQGDRVAPAVGTLAYGTFLAALTAARWTGPRLLDRLGRVLTLRALAGVAVLGLLVFTLTPWEAGYFVGALLWGVGASLGFPVGMSAGADDPALAAPRLGAITSIGYVAFLGGPPLVGLVASALGLPHALWSVIVVLLPAALLASSAAPLASGSGDRSG